LILKQLSKPEMDALLKFAPSYFTYISEAFFHKVRGFERLFVIDSNSWFYDVAADCFGQNSWILPDCLQESGHWPLDADGFAGDGEFIL
jgi:hypothetical protein